LNQKKLEETDKSIAKGEVSENFSFGGPGNHDTIGMIAIDYFGNIASGTSTNGASFKVPG